MLFLITSYFIVALLWWCAAYYPYHAMNGGKGVLSSFLREFSWYIPGGLKRRTAHIERKVNHTVILQKNISGTFGGRTRKSWYFVDIRSEGSYEACAKDVLLLGSQFWFYFVLMPLFWPASLFYVFLIRPRFT